MPGIYHFTGGEMPQNQTESTSSEYRADIFIFFAILFNFFSCVIYCNAREWIHLIFVYFGDVGLCHFMCSTILLERCFVNVPGLEVGYNPDVLKRQAFIILF